MQELNQILKNTPFHHWAYEKKQLLDSNFNPIPASDGYASNMIIDSAFAINDAGILSVTLRYTNDSSFTRARMEVPVNKIERVAYDLFLILECKAEAVTGYEAIDGTSVLKQTELTNLFHLGMPVGDGYFEKEKLQKLLDTLLKYYKN